MIFVAVGTTEFDALVRAVDALALSLSEGVVMQIGNSRYAPRNCEHFRFAPSLDPYYEQANVVVSHGGLGILTEALERGKRVIAVEDHNQPDRHQRELLTALVQEEHLIWCKKLDDLPEALVVASTAWQPRPYIQPECRIHTVVADFLRASCSSNQGYQ